MNSVELTYILRDISSDNPNNIPLDIINNIINTIIRHYMTVSKYYEEDAIQTMALFMNKKVLAF